jgi:hypothetical protein
LSVEDFSSVGGLPVRMGLHAGEASERNGDYFGPAVNRVARLMSIGHGGQVLISGVTRDLAHSDLPAGVSLLDLGSHRLKDLTEAEQVRRLAIEVCRQTLRRSNHSTQSRTTSLFSQQVFVAANTTLEEVKSLLSQHKLVTLFGSGGNPAH